MGHANLAPAADLVAMGDIPVVIPSQRLPVRVTCFESELVHDALYRHVALPSAGVVDPLIDGRQMQPLQQTQDRDRRDLGNTHDPLATTGTVEDGLEAVAYRTEFLGADIESVVDQV